MHKKPARIEDVALLASVSMKTVSRVLNNEPNVLAKTKEKVLQAVRTLNYHPNPSARNLAGKRSYLIGLLYGSVAPAYLVKVQSGVLEACNAAHYGLVLHPCTENNQNLCEKIAVFISQSRIAGLILTPPISDNKALIKMLNEMNLPHVRISSMDNESGVTVGIDERLAAGKIMDHLLALGHTKIGFIRGPDDHGASYWRYESYKLALKKAGISHNSNYVAQGDFTFESGLKAGEKLLSLPNPPTAIFASNDDMAVGVLHFCSERGIKVPDDISVAGFDDVPLAKQVWPSLTTIHQPMKKLGSVAAEKLLQQIKGHPPKTKKVQHQMLDFELVLRGSTSAIT